MDLSVIVCRFAQPLGKFLWRACATQGFSTSVAFRVVVAMEAPRSGHADRAVLRSHGNDCHCLSKSKFFTLLNNSTTDDAANLATLDAIPDATKAVLGNVNVRGRGRKREELRLRGPEVVCGRLSCCCQ